MCSNSMDRRIRVRVLLFAHLSDIRGNEIWLEVPSNATVGQVLQELTNLDERYLPALPSSRLAVNGDWAQIGSTVSDGCEVALIPPVSGG